MASKWNLSKLYVAPEVSFGTEPSADGSGYTFQKTLPDISFQPMAEVIERPGQTGDFVRQQHVIGPKGGTLSFKIEIKASGTPAGSAVVAIAAESSILLQNILGTVVRGTGTTVAAAGGDGVTTPMKATSAAGLSKYMAIEVESQVRFITAISGADVTLNRALSGIPATSAVVYASSLFKRATTGHASLAFVAFRHGIEYTFLGCFGSAKLVGITARGTALLEVTVTVGDWSPTTKAALPSTVDPLSGIHAVKAPVIMGSPCYLDTTEEIIHGLDFDFGQQFVHQDTTTGAQGKSGIELTQAQPAGVLKPYHSAAHLTDFLAGTERALAMSVGSRSTGFGLYLPKVQLGQPTLNNHNGMVGEDLPFFVNDNGTDPEYALSVF